ncbi:GFA family protein [Spongiibacter sp. KMU-166]|uniref:GFA family protein n=1 Tax=Spongiibacter thalassae TaxID=2721624 RepID=A0ABX1GC42_9GAMM|nr:GFA family protein [Spongiibacter thalassae]NKI16511.1 GFA family protein [Spongiibacter thalassae]
MTVHKGACLCGAVEFKVEGSFDSFYLCHCRHCQKDTGSAYAANLFSHSATLSWLAGGDSVSCFMLPGSRHNKCFCKVCGSALPSTQLAGLLVVPAGCLDTEVPTLPTAHIFTASAAAWAKSADSIASFNGLPD